MAITDYSSGPLRRGIGFVRIQPPTGAKAALNRRGYECKLLDEDSLTVSGKLDTTDSVIISYQLDKPSHLIQDLTKFSDVLNYDCRLYVLFPPDLTSQALVLETLIKLKLPISGHDRAEEARFPKEWFDPRVPNFAPFVHIMRADDNWELLANVIANNAAGPPPFSSLTGTEGHSLPDEAELLLKRAFFDCSSIELFPKTEGMSGVDAFEVFAHRRNDVVGSTSPYRCFVKLGPRIQVAREFQKYRTTALENIPFHLGPRLRADRCMLGKSLGLITCDYVVGAETLLDCIRGGRGAHVIGNLFNQTLIAWRRAATEEPRSLEYFLTKHLSERKAIPKHREPLVKAYGSQKTLNELKNLLVERCCSLPVLVGVIHGDLHATNVLVRMNDAVIIDLERIAADHPLLFDAASLEAGLLVDGFVGDPRSADDVLKSIAKFYTSKALKQDDHYCNPASRSAWYVDSIRQIRMQARQMELKPHQYGWTLAAVLLKKACNPVSLVEKEAPKSENSKTLTREDLRAMAFVLGEKIILGLPNHNTKKVV